MRLHVLATVLACLGYSAAAEEDFTTLKGHGGPIMGIAVSQGGQVATASFDNTVGLWRERTPTWLEGHEAAVTSITFLPDGRIASGADDFALRLWNGAGSRILGHHKGKIQTLAASPDGTLLASGSWDGTVRLWSLKTGDMQSEVSLGAHVNAVDFSDDGQTLYVGNSHGELTAIDVATGQGVPLLRHGFGINEVVVGPDWLAYGAVDGGTRVVDPVSSETIADITLDRRPILAMAYHPQTDQLAVGDGHGHIMMLDTSTWRITRDFRATLNGPVWALAFSDDGAVIHAGGLDDSVYSWPVALLGDFEPGISGDRDFLRDPATMPNGERQFTRKCAICHALEPGPSRKAGPTLHGVFGRNAGALADYSYSETLDTADIIWDETSIDALFAEGPDHYIPGSKMPMQVISEAQDRADLIIFLRDATAPD